MNNKRVQGFKNGCLVAVPRRRGAPREMIVDIRYATGVLRAALVIKQFIKLLTLLRGAP